VVEASRLFDRRKKLEKGLKKCFCSVQFCSVRHSSQHVSIPDWATI
jgi:hypothetical protein